MGMDFSPDDCHTRRFTVSKGLDVVTSVGNAKAEAELLNQLPAAPGLSEKTRAAIIGARPGRSCT